MNDKSIYKTISEQEFKHICSDIWAKQVAGFDVQNPSFSTKNEEFFILNDVLRYLRQRLEIENEKERGIFSLDKADDAASCREAISEIIKRSAAQPFDYNKILDKLLHEVL